MNFAIPPPLEIKCTTSDCESDRHCFKAARGMTPAQRGRCRSCGADLIDWPRVQQRDISDAEHTFEMLQLEFIRHHFFHEEIDEGALKHARRKGWKGLRTAIRSRLERYLAPADLPRDGRQTPFAGNAIFYAQHATACCCRTCLAYWHGIPKGRALTSDEIDYCESLVEQFLHLRLPDLGEEGQKIPAARKARSR